MTKLRTLTVPDVLWINLQLTGSPQQYNFATLEEGTFYQFKSGTNNDLAGQAARLLTGFTRLAPMSTGNASTAFIAALAFLEMNGHRLELSDETAVAWLSGIGSSMEAGKNSINGVISASDDHDDHNEVETSDIVMGLIHRFPTTLTALQSH